MNRILVALLVFVGGSAQAQVPPILGPGTEIYDVYYRACAHFYPETLAPQSQFHLDRAVCGTQAILGLKSYWNELPRATKASFAFLLQRPVLANSIMSLAGHFRVHYSTTGVNAVAPTDADGNGIPDYVDETAKVFEEAWSLQITQLGYSPPPSDGDEIYDVYIKNLASYQQVRLVLR